MQVSDELGAGLRERISAHSEHSRRTRHTRDHGGGRAIARSFPRDDEHARGQGEGNTSLRTRAMTTPSAPSTTSQEPAAAPSFELVWQPLFVAVHWLKKP